MVIRVAPGVRDVLQQLHRDRIGGDYERAQAWLAEEIADNRDDPLREV